jgi:hypothetical protein
VLPGTARSVDRCPGPAAHGARQPATPLYLVGLARASGHEAASIVKTLRHQDSCSTSGRALRP